MPGMTRLFYFVFLCVCGIIFILRLSMDSVSSHSDPFGIGSDERMFILFYLHCQYETLRRLSIFGIETFARLKITSPAAFFSCH
jgi:hypothetical protein